MTVFIASDHNGFTFKKFVKAYLESRHETVVDTGDTRLDPDDDFPIFAAKAVTALQQDKSKDAKAIVICGSGQGMLMAANRFKGIRAGLGWNIEAARGIRNDEDSNVLALPNQLLEHNEKLAKDIIDAFLDTPFAGAARYKRRNAELDNLT